MPTTHVFVRHDDGNWYRAELLGQFRSEGRWRAVVRYAVAPGMTYQRGLWADQLRGDGDGVAAAVSSASSAVQRRNGIRSDAEEAGSLEMDRGRQAV